MMLSAGGYDQSDCLCCCYQINVLLGCADVIWRKVWNYNHNEVVYAMEPDKKVVLCVGLVCIDIIQVCESYPKEDSDQR